MIIVEKNEGPKIPYEVDGCRITFDDAMMLNLSKYEQDYDVDIDVCAKSDGTLVTGVIPGVAEAYVAQIAIPARAYDENTVEVPYEDENEDPPSGTHTITERTPKPLDPDKCTLTLWALMKEAVSDDE